jgi:hypothetical protein
MMVHWWGCPKEENIDDIYDMCDICGQMCDCVPLTIGELTKLGTLYQWASFMGPHTALHVSPIIN